MNVVQVTHGSDQYWKTVDLRRRVLRTPLGLDFDQQELQDELHQHHFAVHVHGELKGCFVMAAVDSFVAKMRQVAVEPESQHQGVGKVMVLDAESWAIRQGYKQIVLHARESAVGFYEKFDYDAFGDPFDEVGIPHRKMRKLL